MPTPTPLERNTLHTLFITSIGDECSGLLAAVLPQCESLTDLRLGSNSIEPEGAARLAAALPQCKSLVRLNLHLNGIGPEGARRLAAVLPQCESLAHLDLYFNDIRHNGVDVERLRTAAPPSLHLTI